MFGQRGRGEKRYQTSTKYIHYLTLPYLTLLYSSCIKASGEVVRVCAEYVRYNTLH